MIWFFIILSTGLSIVLYTVVRNNKRERRVQMATLDSLLAIIGDERISLDSSRQYFHYLQNNLQNDDFDEVMQNIAAASELDLVYDENGRLSAHTIDQIVPIFNNYINGVHQRMQEQSSDVSIKNHPHEEA